VSYYLALRSTEAVAMRAEYIDIDHGEAWVPSAKKKVRPNHRVCKHTDRPLIKVPILHGERVLASAVEWAKGRDWMFPAARGDKGHMSTRQMRNVFKAWCREAGFDDRISAHSLRHSAGTHVQEAVGDDVVLIRDYMRHSNIAITNTYLHSTPTKVKKARESMRRFHGKA
jgi:integrase